MPEPTLCPGCGQRLPDGGHFCDGYRGPLDTYMCDCDCHYDRNNRWHESWKARLAERLEVSS